MPFTLENGLLTGIRKLARPKPSTTEIGWNNTPSWPKPRPASCGRCAKAAPSDRCWKPSAEQRVHYWARRPPTCSLTRTSLISVETRCRR